MAATTTTMTTMVTKVSLPSAYPHIGYRMKGPQVGVNGRPSARIIVNEHLVPARRNAGPVRGRHEHRAQARSQRGLDLAPGERAAVHRGRRHGWSRLR